MNSNVASSIVMKNYTEKVLRNFLKMGEINARKLGLETRKFLEKKSSLKNMFLSSEPLTQGMM